MATKARAGGLPHYPNEKAFEAAVIELAEKTGWLVHKETLPFFSRQGFPDLLLAKPARGLLVVLELKVHGTLTAAQREWLAAFAAAGVTARVVYPADIAWIEALLTGQEHGTP